MGQVDAFTAAGAAAAACVSSSPAADAADGRSVIQRLLGMRDDDGRPLGRTELQVTSSTSIIVVVAYMS